MESYRDALGSDQSVVFELARRKFEQLVGRLQEPGTAALDHGELEHLLQSDGFELVRQLLQSHLDLRSLRETRCARVLGTDGVARTHARRRSRPLETIFGRVAVERWVYSGRGLSGVAPMDAALNLPAEVYSHGLRQRVVREAMKGNRSRVAPDREGRLRK